MDVRGYLHRDGSVIMSVSVEDLQNPMALYQTVRAHNAAPSEEIQCCAVLDPPLSLIGYDGHRWHFRHSCALWTARAVVYSTLATRRSTQECVVCLRGGVCAVGGSSIQGVE